MQHKLMQHKATPKRFHILGKTLELYKREARLTLGNALSKREIISQKTKLKYKIHPKPIAHNQILDNL